jgi:hypothetical protein
MSKPSLAAKKAYFAKTRQSNYAASLRLEGFEVCKPEGDKRFTSCEAAASRVRKPNA